MIEPRRCINCGEFHARSHNAVRCWPCARAVDKAQSRALSHVHAAVARGDLQDIATLVCVDCGDRAAAYDHRNYSKPLEVEPVCAACNKARGHAVGTWDAALSSLSLIAGSDFIAFGREKAGPVMPHMLVEAANDEPAGPEAA